MSPNLPQNLANMMLDENNVHSWDEEVLICEIPEYTSAIKANSYYFGHPEWGSNYLAACHRDEKII